MKRQILFGLFLIYSILNLNAQNEFYFNGAADVIFKYPPRGSGGRAFVHNNGNVLTLNFGGDFTGGTSIGTKFRFLNDGKLGINNYDPDYNLTVNGNFKVYNGANSFIYNGSADILLKCDLRGTGGRAMVHGTGNTLVLNFEGDFTGGTKIGDNVYFNNSGNSYITNGNFGLGTSSPAYKLDVVGTIRANEIKVDMNGADFVFEEDYHLMPLTELEKFVKEQKHLPEIAPAGEMTENGTGLGDLNTKLLQKIEELTLYVTQKDKEVKQLMDTRKKDQKEREKLENQIKTLSERLGKIETLISRN